MQMGLKSAVMSVQQTLSIGTLDVGQRITKLPKYNLNANLSDGHLIESEFLASYNRGNPMLIDTVVEVESNRILNLEVVANHSLLRSY